MIISISISSSYLVYTDTTASDPEKTCTFREEREQKIEVVQQLGAPFHDQEYTGLQSTQNLVSKYVHELQ